VVSSGVALAQAYVHCDRLARAHYENFPVASRLLPASMRPHVAAIYAFARTADDFADDPGRSPAERLRLLDDWEQQLVGSGSDPVFVALRHTIREHRIPRELFEDLLSAFRQDVTTSRYETWADVLDYCRRSANPVGRLVLRVAGYEDPGLYRASDAVCTALQLTNFWQDLERDWAIGRLYVPLEDRAKAGAREADLTERQMTAEWRQVMRQLVQRTRQLFAEGRPVCDGVRGRLRWELRLTWLGGSRILDKLERCDFDVFHARPTLGRADFAAMLYHAVSWR
jgi:hydroxysqualene synthase